MWKLILYKFLDGECFLWLVVGKLICKIVGVICVVWKVVVESLVVFFRFVILKEEISFVWE